MSKLTTKKPATKAKTTLDDVIVKRSTKPERVPLLTSDNVPTGKYGSRVDSLTMSKTDKGHPAVDVVYDFTNKAGENYRAKVRYPLDSYHFQTLCDAMIDAGMPNGSPLTQAIGIEEKLEIVYPYEGALGKIVNRRPASKKVAPQMSPSAAAVDVDDDDNTDSDDSVDEIEVEDVEDADDEFDDFLDDEEDF